MWNDPRNMFLPWGKVCPSEEKEQTRAWPQVSWWLLALDRSSGPRGLSRPQSSERRPGRSLRTALGGREAGGEGGVNSFDLGSRLLRLFHVLLFLTHSEIRWCHLPGQSCPSCRLQGKQRERPGHHGLPGAQEEAPEMHTLVSGTSYLSRERKRHHATPGPPALTPEGLPVVSSES